MLGSSLDCSYILFISPVSKGSLILLNGLRTFKQPLEMKRMKLKNN